MLILVLEKWETVTADLVVLTLEKHLKENLYLYANKGECTIHSSVIYFTLSLSLSLFGGKLWVTVDLSNSLVTYNKHVQFI